MNEIVQLCQLSGESGGSFQAFELPEALDQERRREEARIIIATLLARHILAQQSAKEDGRKAA